MSGDETLCFIEEALSPRSYSWRDDVGRRLNSEALHQLTASAPGLSNGGPAVSRDGPRLAVVEQDRARGADNVVVYDLEGRTRTPLVGKVARLPVWDPQIRRIAYKGEGTNRSGDNHQRPGRDDCRRSYQRGLDMRLVSRRVILTLPEV